MRIRDDWKGAFKGAFRKGWEAEKCGKPIKDCPYEWKPGPYAAAERFKDAWRDGWNTARQERSSEIKMRTIKHKLLEGGRNE